MGRAKPVLSLYHLGMLVDNKLSVFVPKMRHRFPAAVVMNWQGSQLYRMFRNHEILEWDKQYMQDSSFVIRCSKCGRYMHSDHVANRPKHFVDFYKLVREGKKFSHKPGTGCMKGKPANG